MRFEPAPRRSASICDNQTGSSANLGGDAVNNIEALNIEDVICIESPGILATECQNTASVKYPT